MYTSDALLEIHERTHRSLQGLLDHCDGFSQDELSRNLEGGFGYPTLLEQFQHVIGAEQYWVGVLNGQMLTDDDDADRASIDALRAFRERVFKVTAAYLGAASDDELSTARRVTTWGNKEVDLIPGNVVLRTQMHVFDHKGQIAPMSRQLGRPIHPGLDFPLG